MRYVLADRLNFAVPRSRFFSLSTPSLIRRRIADLGFLTKAQILSAAKHLFDLCSHSVYMFTKRAAEGVAECEYALALDQNLADAHGAIGMAKILVGRAKETEGHILDAFRLIARATRLLTFGCIAPATRSSTSLRAGGRALRMA